MKSKYLLHVLSLLLLLISVLPASNVSALAAPAAPPADFFQLPWDQGLAWVAIDGLDNGLKRPLSSSHNYTVGGAIDFAPHNNMKLGENTSNFWITAAAAGTVIQQSFCHVKIDHGNGWTTEYQFLANVKVKVGDAVFRNQRLGTIADGVRQKFCPGSADPNVPHLHFMLRPTLRNATLAGWVVGYNPLLNKTTFTKGGQTLGLFQPLLNTLDLQIVLRGPIAFDTVVTGSVDSFHYERWSLALSELTKFTLTGTPNSTNLVLQISLLDANGNVIAASDTGTLTSTQPAGNYFVQIQPQVANGFYSLVLHKNDLPVPTGAYVSVVVNPTGINPGETATVTVNLNHVPADGYTSTEFTCTYNDSLVEVSNITVTDLFGADAVAAINGPQNGRFIVAIAGSNGNKATTDGAAFTFSAKGLQAGQTAIECRGRVSTGDNTLTAIEFLPAALTVLGNTTTPTPTAIPSSVPGDTSTPEPSVTPTATATSIPIPGDWLTFTNSTFGFQFKYPPNSQIESGGTDTDTIIHLPFAPGTNLGTKYVQMIVAENANPCQSPLATQSMLETSETVVINGISFLKQTGQDATAGHINKWTAYSTSRDNVCVSLDFVLRAANPGVFTTPPPLYDEAAESAVFVQIVSTYQWLALSTSTPTSLTPVETATPTSSTPVESATPTLTLTETSTPVPTTGTLTGQVLAGKPVNVSLLNGNTVVTAVTANPDGTFSLTAPAGAYTVRASASGFLSAEGSITLTAGNSSTMPNITLLAGDIDNNGVIDQFDAMTIGMSYNTASPEAADLNNDGVINVLDLELLAQNYRKTGPITWQ